MAVAHILIVPDGMVLPEIKAAELRSSALMDQTSRQPFTTRHLNHMGKYAYELAVSVHLATTCLGVPNIKRLQDILTTENEVTSLAMQFGLCNRLTFQRPQVTEDYNPPLEAFYAWLGAVLLEGGMPPVVSFVSLLLESNRNKLSSMHSGPAEPNLYSIEESRNVAEHRENCISVERVLMTPAVLRSPSKRKLSYSNSRDSLVSDPGDLPHSAGIETMKRRRLARGKPILQDS